MDSSKSKSVLKSGWEKWPAELRIQYDFTFREEKVVHAKCKCCAKNVTRVKSLYRGKLLDDVLKYGQEGTSWVTRFNLERHSKSTGHLKCKELDTGKAIMPKQQRLPFFQANSRRRAVDAVKPLMRIALHVARKEMPLSAFADEVELHCDNGCKMSRSYRNREGCKTLLSNVTEELSESLKSSIKGECHFFSWLTDGSTVNKRKLTYESELVYLRTACGLKPKTEQSDLISMREYVSVNAENLYHATLRSITSLFSDNVTTVDTPIGALEEAMRPHVTKLVGVGADGAAVNFGSNSGLLTRWASLCRWVVKIHCFSHRLELAAKDSLDPHYGHVDDFLQQMYYHFRNSPKEWSSVHSIADKLNLQVVTMPKCFGTRFVSHRKDGLQALANIWVCLILHFSNAITSDEDNKAVGYLSNYLLNYKFLLECSIFHDILSWVSLASNIIQGDDCKSIVDAANQINSLELKLSATASRGGSYEQDAIERFRVGNDGISSSGTAIYRRSTRQQSGTLRKISLRCKRALPGQRATECEYEEDLIFGNASEDVVDNCQKTRSAAATCLREALHERFSGIRCNNAVLDRLKWLNHRSWISISPENQNEEAASRISEFGTEDVSFLYDHFQTPLSAAGCDSKTELLNQFGELKFHCQTVERRQLSAAEFWPTVFDEYGDKFRHVFLLVELLMNIPFSNAVVERGFSAVRRIMTDWRTSLSHDTIRDLLFVSTRKIELESSTTRERLVSAAAERFANSGIHRRINVPDSQPTKPGPSKVPKHGEEGRPVVISDEEMESNSE